MSTTVPSFRDDVAFIPVGDQAVLYEQDTGELHRLDAIAVAVCSVLDGRTSVSDAIDVLVASFDAPREVIETDVLRLVDDLQERGLLVVDAASEPSKESGEPSDGG